MQLHAGGLLPFRRACADACDVGCGAGVDMHACADQVELKAATSGQAHARRRLPFANSRGMH
eukprot:364787-Chlamydomonas_euryale.AAC.11